MASYTAEVLWLRSSGDFVGNRHSASHLLRFDGGLQAPGQEAPEAVPLPLSDAPALDPQEAFVAALSSCHMLWFLALAARRQWCVERYFDAATGIMGKNAEGKTAMMQVTLRPDVLFSGERQPTREELDQLHHEAQDACFVANSVKTEVRCEPIYGPA